MPDGEKSAPANGLFGPGIFGSGIDLSALDDATAWRLGTFFGEQIGAAQAVGYAQAVASIRADLLAWADQLGDGEHLGGPLIRLAADRVAPEHATTTPGVDDV